ncbi:hypothetical protein GCG21_08910 [Pseudactinotalea sp. HY160]|uniref:hypothetical protein n=1 Tax=Pseudactinotalea sp. HY160 TaxID=2654490 RepID=UPI00128AE51D|nr:hypothetical protein [Pseudactinotalea sp. HY160]MPV50124.1 hypothetical protein [Pseudactinotalea sp. HY160]
MNAHPAECLQEAAVTDFAVEESDLTRGYKKIHRGGCANLRDPEPFTSAPNLTAVFEATSGLAVADEFGDLPNWLAPCARRLIH